MKGYMKYLSNSWSRLVCSEPDTLYWSGFWLVSDHRVTYYFIFSLNGLDTVFAIHRTFCKAAPFGLEVESNWRLLVQSMWFCFYHDVWISTGPKIINLSTSIWAFLLPTFILNDYLHSSKYPPFRVKLSIVYTTKWDSGLKAVMPLRHGCYTLLFPPQVTQHYVHSVEALSYPWSTIHNHALHFCSSLHIWSLCQHCATSQALWVIMEQKQSNPPDMSNESQTVAWCNLDEP